MKAALYSTKAPGYFGAARLDLLAMLPRGLNLRLLEVGAGDGGTLRAAKELGIASHTVGIDLTAPRPVELGPVADRFIVGDIESIDVPLAPESFDVIVCADVLEHLVDPWETVKKLAGYLVPGGLFVTSIPNLRNFRVLLALVVKGEFRYADGGIVDRAHLRFFTRKTIIQLFEETGLRIDRVEENMGAYGIRHKLVDRITLGLLHEFFVFQYRILARMP